MSLIDPRAPAPGWQKRWLIAGLDLMPRCIPALLVLTLGMLASGQLVSTARLDQGFVTFLLQTLAGTLVGIFGLTLGIRLIGKSEGYIDEVLNFPALYRTTYSAMIIILPLTVMICSLVAMTMPPVDASAEVHPLAGQGETPLVMAISSGAAIFSSLIIFSSPHGFLGICCMAMLDLRYAECDRILRRAKLKFGNQTNRSLIWLCPATLVLINMALPIALPGVLLLCFWIYAGGREVFGGISGNRKTPQNHSPT